MSLQETLDTLMADIGPLCNLCVVQTHPEDNTWHLALDEHTQVWAELLPEQNSLLLSAAIGTPGPGDRTVLYELLLRYGFAWHVTGGLGVSLDDADDSLHLMQHFGAAELSADRLARHLTAFMDRLRAWQDVVAKPLEPLADALQGNALLDFAVGRA